MGQYTALQVRKKWLYVSVTMCKKEAVHYRPSLFDCPTQVGPHAVNLAGGQAASMRIAKDIMQRHQQDIEQASEVSVQTSKTEEYIQQMRGLLWL